MANKNSKKAPAKKSPKKQPQPRDRRVAAEEMSPQQKDDFNRIFGIVIFALSVLFFFIAVIGGEGLWRILHNFYIGLFGWFAAVVFPILCLVYSVLFTVKKPNKNMTYEVVSIIILVLMVSAFIHIVENQPHSAFAHTVKSAYLDAPTSFNGGFFGGLIGWLLLTFGKFPAIIVDLLVVFVDMLLLLRVTLNQFFRSTAKPVKKVVEKASPYIEERRERRQHRSIDIPLDDEPPHENLDGGIIDNQGGKSGAEDGLGDDATADIIREINETTKRNQKQRTAPKSIDEIVADASTEPKKDDKKKIEQAAEVPEFTVTDDELHATVEEYRLPPINLLKTVKKKSARDVSNELKSNASLLVDTLASFGVTAEITDISRGPTVTRYELKPAAGVRISKITNLSDDIALNLAATNVRIEAPIPGKAAVGIEIPNTVKNTVSMREIIDTDEFDKQKSLLSAGIGKDIAGNSVFCDIAKMPHLLIAGTTGSGKSVCMNSIIVSILYRAKPNEVKFLMIDPKKVEFSKYENIPHLLVPVVTDPRKASGALGWAVSEMLKRYQAFSDTGVRDIEGYNKFVKKHSDMEPMPKIVICIDELADLMMAAPKEVEDSICRLAQMARAAGMHLVIATQRPSVDVITGLIKANISSRIALTVSSQIDSRTILDSGGAEKLLGQGDMLYSPIGASKPLRVQGCYISDEEVEELCNFIKNQGESEYSDEIQKEIESKAAQEKGSSPFTDDGDGDEALDPLFDKAVDVVLENGRASTSFLQRKLSVGYSRGSKIMDQLEEKGIIGPQDGAKPREIRINKQQWIQMQAQGPAPDFTAENTEQISFDADASESDADIEEF
ncbi:MAG: DNA translocase FtsK [Ruminococcaceae bacterium]|nr:DNA translocase FtsK [Oscillospiraceae bacterium]